MSKKDQQAVLGQCHQTVHDPYGYHHYQCLKKAKVMRDGKAYCTVHDPEYIAAKQAERSKKWNAEFEVSRKRSLLNSTAANACKNINPGNPQAAAESLVLLYKALRVALPSLQTIVDNNGNRPNHVRDKINKAVEAIAKAEEKGASV